MNMKASRPEYGKGDSLDMGYRRLNIFQSGIDAKSKTFFRRFHMALCSWEMR